MLFSGAMLPPVAVAWIYGETGSLYAFLESFGLLWLTGFAIWLPVCRVQRDLRLRDGFLVVLLFWLVLGVFGATPLYLDPALEVSASDAVFESMSALTTTGATVLTGLDALPRALLFYRQQLQWLGGMGIIVLAVAILPMLGVGGMQLYRAEMPGPVKDNKLTPRITETAKALWYLYLGFTVACAGGYWLAGMTPFDAMAHSFSTVSLGGFSTHDASLGYFDSPWVEAVAVFFILAGGVNFGLHFLAWRNLGLAHYWRDAELRTYVKILSLLAAVSVAYLLTHPLTGGWMDALRQGIFHAVSIATTTGFTTADFHLWTGFLPVMLLLASFIGACAASTGGGIKVIRFLLLLKQGQREVVRLVHPSARIVVKVDGKPVPDRILDAVWGFFAAYVAVFTVLLLVLMGTGLDQVSAFSAVAACMNNLGPGLGTVGAHYGALSDPAKWLLSLAMLMGRLEIFTVLVLLSPAFWRQ
ncbi:TrkH family potassium uptake protein [Ectothiorhodospira mobilis]|uniref:TrkH family potassium uptake protein n=1 Tax=Ectothiorhodospira mobilis TaxID=195064 RepID=UPI001EE91E6D|nr:TrkH family potassium uptake protein [Ectothiorhodospira mobilis]MCG5535974.1 TrkH family potassium uptake protein [Ectothiorhodospira mobilis]